MRDGGLRNLSLSGLLALVLAMLVIANSLANYAALPSFAIETVPGESEHPVMFQTAMIERSGTQARTIRRESASLGSVRRGLLINISLAVLLGFVVAMGSLWRDSRNDSL
jgi:hypothetical protein